MIINRLIAATLVFVLVAGLITPSFATTLENKCKSEVASGKPISPDCELLNLINAEVAARIADVDQEEAARIADVDQEEAARIAADNSLTNNANRKFNVISGSMEQDSSVCDGIPDADKVSDTSLGELCDTADTWVANYEAICENVPFTRDAVGGVATATVFVMNGINSNIINPMKNFNTGFSYNIPDINVGLGSIDLPLGIGEISLGSIDIPLPTITVPGFNPFGGFPNIPTSAINTAGNSINSLQDCSV